MATILATLTPLATPTSKWFTFPAYVPTKVAGSLHLLNSSGVIKGRVVDANGPRSYVAVTLILEDDRRVIQRTVTDYNGYYAFRFLYIGLPILRYTVIAHVPPKNDRLFSQLQPVVE